MAEDRLKNTVFMQYIWIQINKHMSTNNIIKHLFIASLLLASTMLVSCNETESAKDADPTSTEITVPTEATSPAPVLVQPEADLKAFLHSKEGTYGWKTTADSITYDFFTDGRLHIQGPDGEATMWEGKWKLKGNQLTLISEERKLNETATIKMLNDTLFLGDKAYTRCVLVK